RTSATSCSWSPPKNRSSTTCAARASARSRFDKASSSTSKSSFTYTCSSATHLNGARHTAARELHRRGEAGCHKDRRAREGCSRPPGWRNPASEVLLEPQADRAPVCIADGVVADGLVARLDLEGGGAGLRI